MWVNGVGVYLTPWIVCGEPLKQFSAEARSGTSADCTIIDEAPKIAAQFDHSSDRIKAFVNQVIRIGIA